MSSGPLAVSSKSDFIGPSFAVGLNSRVMSIWLDSVADAPQYNQFTGDNDSGVDMIYSPRTTSRVCNQYGAAVGRISSIVEEKVLEASKAASGTWAVAALSR